MRRIFILVSSVVAMTLGFNSESFSQIDLEVSSHTTNITNVAPGGSITSSIDVANNGAGDAGNVPVTYILSTNFVTGDGDDVILGTTTALNMTGGATRSYSKVNVIPGGTAAGIYKLYAFIDADQVILESTESNNKLLESITVTAPGTSDVDITSFSVTPISIPAGGAVSATTIIENIGSASTGVPSEIRYRLSTDAVYSFSTDVLLADESFISLNASAQTTKNTSLTIPGGTTPGSYFIVARADHDNLFAESNETNNDASFAITVAAPLTIDCNSATSVICGQTLTGQSTVSGTNAASTYSACGSGQNESGKEAIFELVSTQQQDIIVTLSNTSADLDIHILSACDPNACQARGDLSATFAQAPAGTYYIVVDGFNGAEGTFDLDISCAPSGTGGNLDCNSATSISCGQTLTGESNAGGSSIVITYSGCGAGELESGPEKIYELVLTTQSDITAILSNQNADVDVHILGSCDSNSCLARGDASATYLNAPAGTYYIVVDGFNGAIATSYDIEVTCVSEANCANPIVIGCGQVVSGDNTGLPNNLQNYTCSQSTNRDLAAGELIYKFTATETGSHDVTLSSYSNDLRIVVLETSCLESTCITSTAEFGSSVSFNATLGQSYYIIVDGEVISDVSPFNLEVTCPTTPVLDCSSATNINCGQTLTGQSTIGGANAVQDSYGSGCGSFLTNVSGPEKIFKVTTTTFGDLVVDLSNRSNSGIFVWILSSANCDPTQCVAFGNSQATYTNAPIGDYFILVDGNDGASGTFDIGVSCASGSSSNLDCSSATLITCGQTLTSQTNSGGTNNVTTYGPCGTGQDESGPEKVYELVLSSPKDITATLSNTTADLDIHILNSCSGESACLERDNLSATYINAPAGTYYIVVDGFQGAIGNFDLAITCNSGGTCNNPIQLTCGVNYSGNNSSAEIGESAQNLYCTGTNYLGKEVVHKINVPTSGDISISFNHFASLNDDMKCFLIDNSCNGQANCIDEISTGIPYTLTGAPSQDYYLIVDAKSGISSGYNIEVTCPASPSVNLCANKIVLSCVDTTINGTTIGASSEADAYGCDLAKDESGPEKIYEIDITQAGTLTATLSNLGANDLDIMLLSACDSGACLVRDNNSITQNITALGKYYIVVDGFNGAQGTYTLTIDGPCSSTTPPPALCNNVIISTCGSSETGSTVGKVNNISTFGGCGSGQDESGGEEIYEVTTSSQGDLTAALSNMGVNDLDVHILSSCDSNACVARDDNSATYTNAPAGTYYIVVDGFQGAEGTYTLDISGVCSPTSLDCSSATPVTCGQSLTNQTNSGLANNIFDYTSCLAGTDGYSGGEKIYSIDLNINDTLKVSTTFNFEGYFIIFDDCNNMNSSTCFECGDPAGCYNVANFTGTHYIVVDGHFTDPTGTFDISFDCVSPIVVSDLCSNDSLLSCSQSSLVFNGTTVGGSNKVTTYGGCGTGQIESGKEKVYKITPTQSGTLTASLSNLNGVDLDIQILSDCSDSNSCIARDNTSASSAVSANQDYYIVVDGFNGVEGAFTLTVDVPCISGPPSSLCSNATTVNCGDNLVGQNNVGLIDNIDNYDQYGCNSGGASPLNGGEKVYKVNMIAGETLRVTMSNTAPANFVAEVLIFDGCNVTGCMSGFDLAGNGYVETVIPSSGDYYIIVDGIGNPANLNGEGSFDLAITCIVPSGVCTSIETITCSDQVINGNTSTSALATDNVDNYGCASAVNESGKELVYKMTPTTSGPLTVTLSNMTVDLDIHLLDGCDPSTDCIDRNNSTITQNVISGQDYYIVVDGFNGAEGSFTLTVDAPCSTTNPPASLCANKVILNCSDIVINSTTVGASNNANAYGCNLAVNQSGPEVVYEIDVTQAGTLTASLSNLGANDLDIMLLSACDSSACLSRNNSSVTQNITALGKYYIVVDGFNGAQGSFTLTVDAPCNSTPPPTGLDCSGAQTIACGTSITSSNVGLNNGVSTYSGCGTGQDESGPEKVFKVVTTSQGDLTATLSNLSADLDVHILNSCNGNSCVARGDNVATLTNAPAGTYYVVVDGFQGASGTFKIDISCGSTTPPPTGLDCSNAQSITCGSSVSGSNVGLPNGVTTYGGCGSGQDESGGEKVYTIITTSQGDISAVLSNMSADLDVHILSACDENACEARGDNSASYVNAPAGTYYIVVDGFQGGSGTFSLTVDCNGVTPPPGTVCTNASPIACGAILTGQTNSGLSNNIDNYDQYGCNSGGSLALNGGEKVYEISLNAGETVRATVSNASFTAEVMIFDGCTVNGCLTGFDLAGNGYVETTVPVAGNYYIIVDGIGNPSNPSGSGTFDITVSCPGGTVTDIDCSNAIQINCGQTVSGTTINSTNIVSSYAGCNPNWNESGKEVVYVLQTPFFSSIKAELSGMNSDLDIFILDSCSSTSCIAVGDDSATYSNAPAGTYYIVIDGFSGAEGPYSLSVECKTPSTQQPDLIVTNASVNPTTAAPGSQVNLTATVQNSSTASTSSACQVSYYLSVDNLCDPSDVLLNSSAVGLLGSGSSVADNSSVTIPNSIPFGNYYIVWKIDEADVIAESNELNNCAAVPLSIQFSGLDEEATLDVNIFPNPFETSFTIQSQVNIDEIQIVDMLGRVIHTELMNSRTKQIDMGQYENGNYLIKFIVGDVIHTRAIVKS